VTKNAKIRDDSKNTTQDDLKRSSSNNSMMKTIPEEKNAFENNPKSKLTSTDSGSDHSSCDAKKSQGSKIATNHDSDDSSADSNSQDKDANSSSEDSSTSDDSNAIGNNAPQVDHNHYDPNVMEVNNIKEKDPTTLQNLKSTHTLNLLNQLPKLFLQLKQIIKILRYLYLRTP